MSTLMRRSVDEKGFTLIEVGICIVLISITAIGMYNAIVLATRYITDSRRVTKATNIARAMLEEIADDPANTGFYPSDMELPNMRWEVAYMDDFGQAVPQSNVTTVDPLTIQMTVFWQQNSNSPERFVQLSTRITHGLI